MNATDTHTEAMLPEPRLAEPIIDVVEASFYGVLGAREPYATSSGVETFVGCHALNCYS